MHPSPPPRQVPAIPGGPPDDEQVRRWLQLRRELTTLHARLVYIKLMMRLGVSK